MATRNPISDNPLNFCRWHKVENGLVADFPVTEETVPILFLTAPTNLVISNPLTSEGVEKVDELQIDFTSQSGGLESGFEIYYSTDAGVTFSLLVLLGSGITTHPHTGLTYNDTVIYRVRAVGSVNSPFTADVSGTVATNPLIAGALLHSWTRADKVLFNGLEVSSMIGLEGSNRDIVNPVAASQPYHSSTRSLIQPKIDGNDYVYGFRTTGDIKFLENNSNWAGLGISPYCVITIGYFNNEALNFSHMRNEAVDEAGNIGAHVQYNGGSQNWYLNYVQNGLGGDNITFKIDNQVSENAAIMSAFRGDNPKMWKDGVLVIDQAGNQTVSESFDSVIFLMNSIKNQPSQDSVVYEKIFLKFNPEDQPTIINSIYDYLRSRYPSLNIINPDLT